MLHHSIGLTLFLVLAFATTARADEREYWIHADGQFQKVKDDQWTSKWKTVKADYVEVGRTKEYVELFDRKFKKTMRLYADRCERRVGKGPFSKVADGEWRKRSLVNAKPTVKPGERVYWHHSEGHFEKGEGKVWHEAHKGVKTQWVELERTDEFIKLKRNVGLSFMIVHVCSDKCEIIFADGKTMRKLLYEGQWKEKPAVSRAAVVRNYWRHSEGYFKKVEGERWEEVHKDVKRKWKEIKRRDDYVELLHRVKFSNTIVRLYADRCETTFSNSPKAPKLSFNGEWAEEKIPPKTYVATGKAEDRDYWSYEGGHFEKVAEGKWIEQTKDKKHDLEERRSAKAFIELHDAQRGVTLRLYAKTCHVLETRGGKTLLRPIHRGEWGKVKVVTKPKDPIKPVEPVKPKGPWAEIASMQGPRALTFPVLSPDGQQIAVAMPSGNDYKLVLVDVAAKKVTKSLKLPRTTPRLAWSGNGAVLAGTVFGRVGSETTPSQIVIWDAKTLEERVAFEIPGFPRDVAISADGKIVAGLSTSSVLKVWNVKDKKEILSLKTDSLSRMALSADGKTLAASRVKPADEILVVLDLPSGKTLHALKSKTVDGIDLSPDGKTLVEHYYEKDGCKLNVWDLSPAPKAPRIIKGGYWKPTDVQVIDQGRHLAVVGGLQNDEIRVYNLASGKLIRDWVTFDTKNGARSWNHVDANGDGSVLLTYGTDKLFRLWTTPFGEKKN